MPPLPRKKKRQERLSQALSEGVRRCQASTTGQASIGLRKNALSALDEHLKEQAFLNDSDRWSRTSNLSINTKSTTAFYVRLLKRDYLHSKKGKRLLSSKFTTKIEAENHAFWFRKSNETEECQARLDHYIAAQRLMFASCEQDVSTIPAPSPNPAAPTAASSPDESNKRRRLTSSSK